MTLSEQMRQISENAWDSKVKEDIMQTIMQQIENHADFGKYEGIIGFGNGCSQGYAERIKSTLESEGFKIKNVISSEGREKVDGIFVDWHEPKGKEAKIMYAKSKLREAAIVDRLYRNIVDFIKSEASEGKRKAVYEFDSLYITKAMEVAVAGRLELEGFTAPVYLGSSQSITISW